MIFEDIKLINKDIYNLCVDHPLQSYEWGEFRKKTGINVIRRGSISKDKILNPYQLTVHKTPGFPYLIGYLPKGELPKKELLDDLKRICEKEKISFVQLEPNSIVSSSTLKLDNLSKSFHPLFTKFTFILNLEKNEEEILKEMSQKTRYNIRLSEKKKVKVEIDNSKKAFEDYLKLTEKTTKRQEFYAHDKNYHIKMWQTLGTKSKEKYNPKNLQAHLLKASYKNKTLVTYVLFTFKDTLYYPYGASSDEHREVMASHGAMFGAIKFGKELGLKKFDMWGAANTPDPKPSDKYYGFHRFKKGFGGQLVEFVGSYDLVINPINYRILSVADKLRWAYLKTKKSK